MKDPSRPEVVDVVRRHTSLSTPAVNVDYQLWWKQNQDVVCHGLMGGSWGPSSSSFSLNRFNQVYHLHAIYEDLFIVTHGRRALRYSFALIGSFWEIQLKQVGPILAPFPNETAIRVPYTIQQRPKYFTMLGWYQYNGWMDLYLKPTKPHEEWKVVRHDDRMEHDPLARIQGIPIMSTLFECFRQQHGSIVKYFAEQKYGKEQDSDVHDI